MKKRVLIFDDDLYFTEDLADLLAIEGVGSTVANSADDVFMLIDSISNYDAVFLDIMARRGEYLDATYKAETGELLYGLIREKYPDKKVIVISAKNKTDIGIDFSKPNCFYIQKPLSDKISEIFDVLG